MWILRVRVQKIIWEVYEKYMDEKEKHVWETHGLYGKYLANIWETPGKQTMECTEFILDFPTISVVKCLLGKNTEFYNSRYICHELQLEYCTRIHCKNLKGSNPRRAT